MMSIEPWPHLQRLLLDATLVSTHLLADMYLPHLLYDVFTHLMYEFHTCFIACFLGLGITSFHTCMTSLYT